MSTPSNAPAVDAVKELEAYLAVAPDEFGAHRISRAAVIRIKDAMAAALAAQAPGAVKVRDGIELAAKWVEKRHEDYVRECGIYDPSTGVTEFRDGGEYVGELEEIIEGIRSLSAAPPVAREPLCPAPMDRVDGTTARQCFERGECGCDEMDQFIAESAKKSATPAPSQQPAGEAGGLVERQPGFYWVENDLDGWQPAEWTGKRWYPHLTQNTKGFEDEDIGAIGARMNPTDAARIAELEAEVSDLLAKWDLAVRAAQEVISERDAAEARATKAEAERDLREHIGSQMANIVSNTVERYHAHEQGTARQVLREWDGRRSAALGRG